MATLSTIAYRPRRPELADRDIQWTPSKAKAIPRLPQIFWKDGSTWGEANLWALRQAHSQRDLATISRSMWHLVAYAKWLESEDTNWWHFPAQANERCLDRFRGALIQARSSGELSPSTVSQRMATVVRFYRWLQSTGLLSTYWPIWEERHIGIRLSDGFGFSHTLRVTSTSLSIPNRKIAGALPLEDGLLPVSISNMNDILGFAESSASEELYLMLLLGFRSGMRIGSIADLKVETLLNATVDPAIGWHRIAVGPSARPSVATKFGVNGMVPILTDVLDKLTNYACSTRRLKRQALALEHHRDILFLTRNGRPYGLDDSRSINVAMSRLRKSGAKSGIEALENFHFHRCRATFATELTRVALRCMPLADAIDMVRESCLHRDVATTLKYVKFIEKSKGMAAAADAFTTEFLGLARGGEPNA